MEELEKIIKDINAWKSIKNTIIEKKRINKMFVESFEDKEGLKNNREWLRIKNDIKYL